MKKTIAKYTKEELELLSYKDITNLILNENSPMNTADLFKMICNLLELSDKDYELKIGDYYTSLTTDKRFIMLEDGCWDLRDRHKSDKIVKIEDEEDDEDDEEDDEGESDDVSYDSTKSTDDYDDTEDELKDLVIIDEDELEME